MHTYLQSYQNVKTITPISVSMPTMSIPSANVTFGDYRIQPAVSNSQALMCSFSLTALTDVLYSDIPTVASGVWQNGAYIERTVASGTLSLYDQHRNDFFLFSINSVRLMSTVCELWLTLLSCPKCPDEEWFNYIYTFARLNTVGIAIFTTDRINIESSTTIHFQVFNQLTRSSSPRSLLDAIDLTIDDKITNSSGGGTLDPNHGYHLGQDSFTTDPRTLV